MANLVGNISKAFDFIVIGGGIVGLSVAHHFTSQFPEKNLLVLEKESVLAFHQTGHNSGVFHSGIYYPIGSKKARYTKIGNEKLMEFCKLQNVNIEQCGKVIVATKEKELNWLYDLHKLGKGHGLDIELLNKQEIQRIEPYVECIEGILVKSAGIVDFTEVGEKMGELAENKGGTILREKKVTEIIEDADGLINIKVNDSEETYRCKFLINCGGLYADRLAKLAGLQPPANNIPFRGEFYELKPQKNYLVNHLIYPVPNPDLPFVGVHLTRMINTGKIRAGPNAVLSFSREGYLKTDFNYQDFKEIITYPGFWKLGAKYMGEGAKEYIRSFSKGLFVSSLQELVPQITAEDIIVSRHGVRSQALARNGELMNDFLILNDKNAIHVCNAPSPAATASLEIGNEILNNYKANYGI